MTVAASAACATGSTSSSATPPGSSPAGTRPITVTLFPAPSGTANLKWDPASKVITADIDAYGFTPGSAHAMHIHPGTCANQNQPPSVAFSDVLADAGGAAKASIRSQSAPSGVPAYSYLNIHLAPMAQLGTPKDVSFTPILCADISAGTPAAGPVTLHLRPPPARGVTLAGTAILTYNPAAHTLGVELRASGLAPGSAHAVHVHTGSCRAQGAVLYPLPDLIADSAGNAQARTTITNVTSAPSASGWYVNVHFGPMSKILNAGKPTLLFAPVLCGDVTG